MKNALKYVCVGDTVEVCFTHEAQPRTFNLKVGTITRRYGNNRDGTRINPLVAGTIEGREKTVECDLKFVRRVISRAKPVYPRRNLFREIVNDCGSLRLSKDGLYWMGHLNGLARNALALLPYEINRPLHDERLRVLYGKSSIGCSLGAGDWYKVVHKKKFCKWIAKNWHRILMTSKELHVLANQELEQQRRDLEDDADIETEPVIDSRSWNSMMDEMGRDSNSIPH